MRFNKLFLPMGLLALGVLWGACVDVPDGPATVTNPDFRSQVRFVHAVPGGGAGNVNVDGSSVGNIGYLAATSYGDVASGSRSITFGAFAAQTVVFGSEQQSTVLIYSTGAATPSYLNLAEGHMDKNNGKVGVAKVRFVNVAQGAASNVTFHANDVTEDPTATSGFGAATGYTEVDPASIAWIAQSVGSYGATLNGDQEVPAVTTTSRGVAVITQDAGGVHYSVEVTADNFQGFYTAAHFHNEAAGTNGPVVRPISVTGQSMTFADAALSGANEAPLPVATSATGTAAVTLFRDRLEYTIDVTADTLDTVFVAAHFHNAAAGTNGPVVKTIATGVFSDTSITGEWTSTDSEPLTPTLIAEIIAGRVYVNFHTVLNPGGAIRAQLIVDSTTTTVYAGTWSDSTLTAALQEEYNLDRIYVNFHTAGNPGGQIRGQVVQTAKYGLTTLPAAAYDDSKMYTIIASGAGSTFQLTTLPDRQVAVPPTGKPQASKARK